MRSCWMLLLLFCLLWAAGCSNEPAATNGGEGPEESGNRQSGVAPDDKQSEEDKKAGREQQVLLSRSDGFGTVNGLLYATFTRPVDVDVFAEALRTAKKIEGVLDVGQPDYDAVLELEDARLTIHLWIDSQDGRGMFVDASDTGTGYIIDPAVSMQIAELIARNHYGPEQAAANGDVVDMRGNLQNADRWARFADSVARRDADLIHVTHYTTEGDPIFEDLAYDGNAIKFVYDNRHDKLGNPMREIMFCDSLDRTKLPGGGTRYSLGGCEQGGTASPRFELVVPGA